MIHRCGIVVAGFGNVGRSLVRLLLEKTGYLAERYRVDFSVLAVGDSSGFVYKRESFSREELEKLLQVPRGKVCESGLGSCTRCIDEVFDETLPDFLVELTPANYDTGEPGLTYMLRALKRGINIVTANKAPLVLKFRELMELASRRRVRIGFRATVFGGVPIIDVVRHLAAHKIRRITGILNATTNYILSRVFYDGLSLEQAVDEARKIGVMEANAALDLEGIDAAAKAVILANVAGLNVTLSDVSRKGITLVTMDDVKRCISENKVIKLVAEIDLENKYIVVEPRELPSSHDLAQVKYLLNAVLIETDLNTIFVKGIGGGPAETAINVLSELVELATSLPR